MSMAYFEKDDILHVSLADGEESRRVEITPDITAKLMGVTDALPTHLVVAEDRAEYMGKR